MSCPSAAPAPLRCPTFEESLDATAALAPSGRAWPVNDGGGAIVRFLAWLTGLNARTPGQNEWPAGYVQVGWFAAVASVRNFIETRLCALRLEFWCATQTETNDLWMREYGLPDPCDPYPDLCAKVAAIGGTRCDYYADVAARAGWSIDCEERRDQCGAAAGCGMAGRAKPGARLILGQLLIRVFTADSPAYGARAQTPPLAGRLRAGRPLSCGPDIGPLVCVLERVIHAEIETLYQTV